ncbi:mechanosensitive ion channel family protein, partial [Glutamicibacter arilaitensis]
MTPTPVDPIDETVEEVITVSSFLPESLQFWVVLLVGAVVAAILAFVFSGVARRVLRRIGVDEADVKAT